MQALKFTLEQDTQQALFTTSFFLSIFTLQNSVSYNYKNTLQMQYLTFCEQE